MESKSQANRWLINNNLLTPQHQYRGGPIPAEADGLQITDEQRRQGLLSLLANKLEGLRVFATNQYLLFSHPVFLHTLPQIAVSFQKGFGKQVDLFARFRIKGSQNSGMESDFICCRNLNLYF